MKEEKSNKKMANKLLLGIIIGIVIGLIVGGVASYFIFNNRSSRGNFGNFRNFQLNETQINEVSSFFSSNPSSADINSYCEQNRMNCLYYCRSINANDAACKNITMMGQGNQFYQGGQAQ
jgi:hypothetical protein